MNDADNSFYSWCEKQPGKTGFEENGADDRAGQVAEKSYSCQCPQIKWDKNPNKIEKRILTFKFPGLTSLGFHHFNRWLC